MDLIKLEGIISAIESESLTPAPSHLNLARLCGMALREIAEQLKGMNIYPAMTAPLPETVTMGPKTDIELTEYPKKPHSARKKTKKKEVENHV